MVNKSNGIRTVSYLVDSHKPWVQRKNVLGNKPTAGYKDGAWRVNALLMDLEKNYARR